MREVKRSLTLGPYDTKDPALARLFGSTPVSAGVSVNEETAMNLSAVWAAVGIYTNHVGSLPRRHVPYARRTAARHARTGTRCTRCCTPARTRSSRLSMFKRRSNRTR